ncbi:MAG TPA: class I tRNA ligase family protein, partial [Candidatus Polarisedimenticolia bacterium]|nr:class I tRNA ligase family protein [Candidatus Polarisedimenticolia bacterium]
HEYCDWYLEMCKPALAPRADPTEASRARAVLVQVLDRVLRLLHPVMPFLTEELWQRLPHRGESILLAPYPSLEPDLLDGEAEATIDLLMEVTTRVRNVRAELNIDPGRRLDLLYHPHDADAARRLRENTPSLCTLARLAAARPVDRLDTTGPAARAVARRVDLAVPLSGVIDLEAERRRLGREIDKLRKEQAGHTRKLQNEDFLAKARPEVVERVRRIHAELEEKVVRLEGTLQSIGGPALP